MPKIVHLQYDSKQKDQLVIVSENGKHEFSIYILPKSNISYSAYLVNGMTIKTIKSSVDEIT